jgi:hypothetical protein
MEQSRMTVAMAEWVAGPAFNAGALQEALARYSLQPAA